MEDFFVYQFPALGGSIEPEFVRGLVQHRVARSLTEGSIRQRDPLPCADHGPVDPQNCMCLGWEAIFAVGHRRGPLEDGREARLG